MKMTPRESGVEWLVRDKNLRDCSSHFSSPPQAPRILKAPPPWRLAGDVAAYVVSRIWLDDA